MISQRINLKMVEGVAFWAGFTWETGSDETGWSRVDLTGYTGVLEIRSAINSALPLASLTTVNGGLSIPAQTEETKGDYEAVLAGLASQGWCPAHKDVQAVYGLRLSDADGVVQLYQHGELLVEASVARPWEAQP